MIRTIVGLLAVVGAMISATVYEGSSIIVWLLIILYFGMDYWVFRDNTIAQRKYEKLLVHTPFERFLGEQFYARQAELEMSGGDNIVPLKVDRTLDLRRRAAYPHHTVRIIRAIERADDGNVIKIIGDEKLTLEQLKIGCQFTDSVLRGWTSELSGHVIGYIYKVPAMQLSGEYKEKVEMALETMEIPQDDAELERLLWEMIRKNPTYSAYNPEVNGIA